MTYSVSTRSKAGRAPGRPKPARGACETQASLVASKPAQAGSEPRHSLPSGDRRTYSFDEGFQ